MFRGEFFGSFAQSCEAAAPVSYLRSDRTHELDAVLVDPAHGVETVGHDFGTREPLAHEPSVWAEQIDTDQADLFASIEGRHEGRKLFFAFSGMHLKDPVVLQVTEGGAEALPFMQGVFVDSRIEWAVQADT